MKNKVLIVDDQADIRQLLGGILEDEGYTAITVPSGEEALDAIQVHRPHAVLLDVWLANPRFDGMYFLDLIKKRYQDLPVIMISGHSTIETAVNSLKKGAYDFIEKPFKTDVLLNTVKRSCELFRLRAALIQMQSVEEGHGLVGLSSKITALRQRVLRSSKANSRILLQGPTGIGKQSLARFIHAHSARREAPFTVLHCEAGKNTGFRDRLWGLNGTENVFMENGDGTLYLSAVENLNLDDQSFLLNNLREHTFNTRIVCGTTKSLNDLVQKGAFLEDLFFRIDVVTLDIPPLKDRCEDIPLIFEEVVKNVSKSFGGTEKSLSKDALVMLQAYNWPGNIQQMKNVVESLYIHYPNDPNITADMLPDLLQLGRQADVSEVLDAERMLGASLKEAREQFEKVYLSLHLARFNGNISKMSRAVGMDRTALHRKIKQLSLQSEQADEVAS